MSNGREELVFAALGGLGEIGMNAALYGFGPEGRKKWMLVDCGISFAGDDLPGIDVLLPDTRFIEEERGNLAGIVITHAHEDHIGALVDLWPRLRAPVYATRFTADLIAARKLSEPGAPKIPLTVVPLGGRIKVGPFDVEFISVAHSIPESNALAIRCPLGLVVHTGDWKIDKTPLIGPPTDEARLKALGDEGVLAMVCDSTNVLREGISPSETDVAATLRELIANAPKRVAVTTFASNVSRVRAVAEAALACGREVVVAGRAMDRTLGVARELGYLDGLPAFRSAEAFDRLPRDKVVALLTGSQGEPRAALARVAIDEHPDISLSADDRVIFSSRAIPGNERGINDIINSLVARGVDVVTDRTALVHVSGHPRRDELAMMYGWIRPEIAVPAHGEALHLSEHEKFARLMGAPQVVRAMNGQMVRLAPGRAEIVDNVPVGQRARDGNIILSTLDGSIEERRKLAFSGIVTIAIAMRRGTLAGDPEVDVMGLPPKTRDGASMFDLVGQAVDDVLKSLSPGKKRDPDAVEQAVERAVRGAVNNAWGKRPACRVLVVEV